MPAVKFFARLDLEEVSEDSEIPRFGTETSLSKFDALLFVYESAEECWVSARRCSFLGK